MEQRGAERRARRAEVDTVREFLRGTREGLDRGLGPLSAAQRAADDMPDAFREALDGAAAEGRAERAADGWGFDPGTPQALSPALEFLYELWWRVRSTGLQHLPAPGPALIVANHAGSLFPFDAAMIATAIRKHDGLGRWPRFLVLEWALSLPLVGDLIRSAGGVPAKPPNAAGLLAENRLVTVFPEGVKGPGKPFSERYRLRRFGTGFAEVAIREGAPIVPVAVVGSEEIYPKLGDSEALARLVGAPYFPITPIFPALGPLGLIPLPSRWRIEFCEPIRPDHPPEAASDPAVAAALSDRVRDLIQRKLHENLVLRGPPFAA